LLLFQLIPIPTHSLFPVNMVNASGFNTVCV